MGSNYVRIWANFKFPNISNKDFILLFKATKPTNQTAKYPQKPNPLTLFYFHLGIY